MGNKHRLHCLLLVAVECTLDLEAMHHIVDILQDHSLGVYHMQDNPVAARSHYNFL